MDYVSDIILETKDRDHMVFTYNNESQFKEIVNAYVRRGIDRNQINVLLIMNKQISNQKMHSTSILHRTVIKIQASEGRNPVNVLNIRIFAYCAVFFTQLII
jgi:hypothetical protein